MSELRFDPTTSDWVIFAPSRSLRPHAPSPRASAPSVTATTPAPCPFCPGNEALTPPEIYSIPGPDNGPARWKVRVVPNKFPALRIEDNPTRLTDGGHFHSMAGCGAHEVIVESPDHQLTLAQQPVDQIEAVLGVLQTRYEDLMRDPRFQTVIIFKNYGVEAGTSLPHPHWQLIATAVVPRLLRLKHFEASQYFDRTGECLYCELIQHELKANTRIVARNEDFIALMPYAAHSPFETWILPLRHHASFRQTNRNEMHSLTMLLKQVLLKLHTGLNNPAYNLTINDVPRGDEDNAYFLWHIRIVPRITTPAGFELGSGMSINTVLPENARDFLDEVPIAPC